MGRGYKNQKRRTLRVLCAALLTGILTASMACPALAETARATTMKLEKIEGSVTLKTINGTGRKPTAGMRLLNGNTLETAAKSYAYVSLDATKAVKVDQNSVVSLRQSGKQLELFVKSGQMFFNVSKKLDSSESMNVRTSTMVTGIRGTCGVVEKVSPVVSKLYLIEGKVTLGSGKDTTVVNGGEIATVVNTFKPETEEKPGVPETERQVTVEKMTEKAIPPVALQAIVDNPVLQKKIEKTTALKVEKIEAALEEFKKAEAESNESEKDPSEEEQKETGKETSSDSTNSTPTDTPTGGGDVPSTPSVDPPADPPASGGQDSEEIPADSQTLTGDVTLDVLSDALAKNQTVIMDSAAKITLVSGNELIIPAGKTLVVQSVIDTVAADKFTYGFQMYTGSTLTVSDGATLKISGTIGTSGDINVGEKAAISVDAGGLLQVDQLNLNTGSRLTNDGTLDCGTISGGTNTTVTNNSLIKLWGTYTTDRSATDGYKGSESSALILGRESATMPAGSLLAVNSTKNMFCYADQLNENVAKYLNNDSWTFSKDAIVPSGSQGIELTGFSADFGTNKLEVRGALNLMGTVNIVGTGAALSAAVTSRAVIYLRSTGTLTFDSAASGSIGNTGNEEGFYAIGVDDTVLNTGGRLNWIGTGIAVKSGTGNVEYTLMGISKTDNGSSTPTYGTKYVNANGGTLAYIDNALVRVIPES